MLNHKLITNELANEAVRQNVIIFNAVVEYRKENPEGALVFQGYNAANERVDFDYALPSDWESAVDMIREAVKAAKSVSVRA